MKDFVAEMANIVRALVFPLVFRGLGMTEACGHKAPNLLVVAVVAGDLIFCKRKETESLDEI